MTELSVTEIGDVNIEENILQLSVSSNFIKDTIITKYFEEILRSVKNYMPNVVDINITIKDNTDKSITDLSVPGSLFSKTWNTKTADTNNYKPKVKNIYEDLATSVTLDKKLTFENFVVAQPNEFAYEVSKNIATNETAKFNPLFIYGGVGLGKTHLMQSIAWYKRNNQSNKKVLYVSAERFMYLFLRSLRFRESINFKELFREVDVLMIDDVQFIGGKNSTQEEFMHTINEFINANRQVVLSANKVPSEIPGINHTLKSRLCGGLIVDVLPTTYELRVDFLRHRSKKLKISLPLDVIEFLADKISSSIREVEGALNRLIAHATLVEKQISLTMASDVLKDIVGVSKQFISLQTIQNQVCSAFAIDLADMLSSTRVRSIVIARQVAMYLSKELTNHSYSEIGKVFGNRDHSTVIHAVKSIRDKIDFDHGLNSSIESIKKACSV